MVSAVTDKHTVLWEVPRRKYVAWDEVRQRNLPSWGELELTLKMSSWEQKKERRQAGKGFEAPLSTQFNSKAREFHALINLKKIVGFPWCLSGKESTCQHRRHRFDSQPGKISHATEAWSLCITTIEPVCPRACALQQRSPCTATRVAPSLCN